MMNTAKVKMEAGTIKFGRLGLKRMLERLDDGDYIIEALPPNRSLRANRLYWKWLTIIGDEIGYKKEELHELFIDMYAPIYQIPDLNGEMVEKRKRTSAMNKREFWEYMNSLDQFAAENDIILPQPEEDLIP